MFDRIAERLYDLLAERRRTVRVVLLALILASLAGLFAVSYDSSMDDILPRDPETARTMRFFRNSDVTGKVVLSLGLADPDADRETLLSAVDRVAAGLDRSLFIDVQTGVSEADLAGAMEQMLRRLPEMTTAEDLAWVEDRMTRRHVAETLRSTYLQLLKPQGMFLGSLVRTDPLGLNGRVLQRAGELAAATGYDVEVRDGHFVSRDGRHALIIAKSTVPVVDAERARGMLASLQGVLSTLPPSVTADVVSGHAHTVSNEQLIRRDVNIIGLFATAGFFLLYVVLIRDLRSVLIFLVPYVATLFAIPASALFLGSMSYWVIGLGSTVAGITIDYGSHVYFSAGGRRDADSIVKQLIKPISFGAFTTVAVFMAFFASQVAGYAQLAVFSILCVLASTFLALFVLPHLLPRTQGGERTFVARATSVLEGRPWSRPELLALWAVLTAVLFYHAVQVEFERDIRRIDGTEQSVLDAEERFHRTWGGRKLPAVLVAAAPTVEEALALNETVYADAAAAVGREAITSIVPLLPSEATRTANAERWRSFWTQERRQRLRALLAEEGRPFGFSPNAFEPFFAGLDRPPDPGTAAAPAEGVAERFLQKVDGGFQVLSFFADSRELLEPLRRVSERHPGTYLVSGTLLSERISAAASRDLKVMSVLATLLVLVVTYAAFGNVRETVIAMVPPVVSLVWLFGIMRLAGMPINAANMIAGVIVIGLSSDYGIFMSFLGRHGEQGGTIFSITLCTVTTVIGAGALLFARHPALWSVGVTVVSGVTAGYLTSLLVVPKLMELWPRSAAAERA